MRILHYDGTAWNIVQSATILRLYGIWGVSANSIWAVGDAVSSTYQGAFIHYDGSSWTSVNDTNLAATSGRFNAVWAASDSFVYACGVKGLLVRYNGTTWNTITSNTSLDLHSIWGTPGGMASSKVFATGDSGLILRIDYASTPGGWSIVPSTGTGSTLYGIHGDGINTIYAVGASGAVVRADGPDYFSFSPQTSNSTSIIFAVHTTTNGLSWLGGIAGYLGYLDLRP